MSGNERRKGPSVRTTRFSTATLANPSALWEARVARAADACAWTLLDAGRWSAAGPLAAGWLAESLEGADEVFRALRNRCRRAPSGSLDIVPPVDLDAFAVGVHAYRAGCRAHGSLERRARARVVRAVLDLLSAIRNRRTFRRLVQELDR